MNNIHCSGSENVFREVYTCESRIEYPFSNTGPHNVANTYYYKIDQNLVSRQGFSRQLASRVGKCSAKRQIKKLQENAKRRKNNSSESSYIYEYDASDKTFPFLDMNGEFITNSPSGEENV
jgi:hypothetical protein